jgi:hypothetical protein
MCAWLLIWAGAHLIDGDRAAPRAGPRAAQAADGAVVHVLD